jgi:hypothetical protein
VLIDDQVKEIAEYVTAIAAAEQQAEYREQSGAAWYHGHEQGQRDMLAKCIEVVEALRACEQRARQDERTRMSPEWVYQQGYDNGLYDARIAVMKLCEKQPSTWPTSEAAMDELTDTINALKEQP